jgi:hypothetical protein
MRGTETEEEKDTWGYIRHTNATHATNAASMQTNGIKTMIGGQKGRTKRDLVLLLDM